MNRDYLENYAKRKDFLICIDSDGCAMDTMDIKHKRCFGPCLIEIWNLDPWKEEVQNRWNEINLYTMTRGVNRFKGLAMLLTEVNEKYQPIPGIEKLELWVQEAKELSNASVSEQWRASGERIFQQALAWSIRVNKKIESLPKESRKAFNGVSNALEQASKLADVAVISSANYQAVMEEWREQGLLDSVNVVLTQDAGTKADCIRLLVKKGYQSNHVLMVGDAPGDLRAAEDNGIFFYPILVRRESKSWEDFGNTALDRLIKDQYQGDFQRKMDYNFKENLSC